MSVLKVKDNGAWIEVPSIKGDTGDAAGFGSVTATVDLNVGTPTVTVTSSGEDTAKNFAFAFQNLGYDDAELKSDFADLEDDFGDLQTDFTVLQGQFDTAVAAVTTDTEVTDIRVGADGVTDTTAGASVRRQFTDLKADINPLYEHASLNLANPNEFTRNAWMANNGTITYNNSTYFITGHIPVTAGKKYFTGGPVNGAARFVTLFNGNTVVSGSLQNIREFTIPSGVDNIVITGYLTDIDAFMVNEGLYLLPYRPYFVPRADGIEDNVSELTAENTVNYDGYSYLSSFDFAAGSLAGLTYIRFSANRCPIDGRLKSITLLCPPTESGTITIYLAKASNATAKIYAHFDLTLHTLPFENTVYYNGIDFQYDGVVENGTIFGAQTSGGARLFYGTDGTGSFTCTDNLWVDSETFKITAPNSYNIGLGYEVIATDDDYKNVYKVKNKTVQLTDYKYYLDGDVINVMFELNALTGKLNLYRDNQNATKGSRVDFVDFANGKIGFYKPSGNATTETLEVLQEKALGFSLVVGHQYVAESIREHGTIHTIKLTDACTMQNDSLTISNSDAPGLCWGVRGYQEKSCDIDVMRSKAFSTQPYGAKVLVIGDSYIEGASIGGYKDKRWCALLREALNGDVFINGLSGAPSAWLVDWLSTYLKDLVNPDYVIVQVGVNDGTLSTYETNMGKIIDLIKNYYHAIPVLVTIPPTVGTASASIWSSINAFVKASGELYIDEALVLSDGYDGASRDSSKFLSDDTHPNVAGHQAIFDRLKCDVPEIFIQ